MNGKVVHFEIPYDDGDRARGFYAGVFGWQLMPVPDLGYTLATTGPTSPETGATEPGFINGGLVERGGDFQTPDVVIDVENIEDTLAAVTAAGGTTVRERIPVGEMGFTAYFRDSEGNLVGLWETAPTN